MDCIFSETVMFVTFLKKKCFRTFRQKFTSKRFFNVWITKKKPLKHTLKNGDSEILFYYLTGSFFQLGTTKQKSKLLSNYNLFHRLLQSTLVYSWHEMLLVGNQISLV